MATDGSDLAICTAHNQLENVRGMHKCMSLEPVWARHTWELAPCHARIVPHLKVLHAEHPGRPLVAVCEALEEEDLDDGAPCGSGHHHQQISESAAVHAEENGWPCGEGEFAAVVRSSAHTTCSQPRRGDVLSRT
jgi:hypothetical protein